MIVCKEARSVCLYKRRIVSLRKVYPEAKLEVMDWDDIHPDIQRVANLEEAVGLCHQVVLTMNKEPSSSWKVPDTGLMLLVRDGLDLQVGCEEQEWRHRVGEAQIWRNRLKRGAPKEVGCRAGHHKRVYLGEA